MGQISQPLPDSSINYDSTLIVEVDAIQVSAVSVNGVPFNVPLRHRTCQFARRRHEQLDDLTDWPAARQRSLFNAEGVMGAVDQHGQGRVVPSQLYEYRRAALVGDSQGEFGKPWQPREWSVSHSEKLWSEMPKGCSLTVTCPDEEDDGVPLLAGESELELRKLDPQAAAPGVTSTARPVPPMSLVVLDTVPPRFAGRLRFL
jgi:hypothetical protein